MRKEFLILFFLMFATKIFAQAPSIAWQNTIGGSQGDRTWQIIQTLDGGYLVSGESNSGFSRDKSEQNHGTFDFWIVKLNVTGGIEWQKTLGGNLYNNVPFITQTPDGSYMVAGSSNSGISGNKTVPSFGSSDIWLIKLNAIGTILWQKTIGGSSIDDVACIDLTSNGNLLIGAVSFSGISGLKTEACRGLYDYWLLELDQQGNIIWQKTLGGSEYDTVSSFIKLPDNSYLIAGTSASNISIDKTENGFGDNDFWILKLDPNRNIEWQKTIGGNERDNLSDIILMPDNCFMVGGESYSGVSGNKTTILTGGTSGNDFWAIKMNLNGEIIWQKSYGGNGSDGISNLDETLDGNYVLTGISNSDISGDKTENSKGDDDIWIIKINENGTILWDKTLGGSGQDYLLGRTMVATSDGGFIVASTSLSPISGDKTEWATSSDYWIVKFDADNLKNESFLDSKNILIYPNPTSDKVNINLKNNLIINKIKIVNELGQILEEIPEIKKQNYTLQLKYEVGIYFLKIENQNNQIETVKIIKTN